LKTFETEFFSCAGNIWYGENR